MLVLVITGLASFLGGRTCGYREAMTTCDRIPFVTQQHFLFSKGIPLSAPSMSLTKEIERFAVSFASQLKKDVNPDVWTEAGGTMSAEVSILSSGKLHFSVNVTAHPLIQLAVADYIAKARKRLDEKMDDELRKLASDRY
jgi:hypothetical protein